MPQSSSASALNTVPANRYTPVSPSKPTSGSIVNHSARSNVTKSRDVLRMDLQGGRLARDATHILPKILKIYKCNLDVSAIRTACQMHINDLKNKIARGKEPPMYEPLTKIFRQIESTCLSDPRSEHRQAIFCAYSSVNTEGITIPDQQPDFVIADLPPRGPTQVTDTGTSDIKLRQLVSFIEVKVSESNKPWGQGTSVGNLASQAADYAGFVLAGRPFQVYTVGMVIFGIKFAVCVFDRAGGAFTQEFDIEDDFSTFISVIRRLLCDSSPQDLGQDPTVELESGHKHYQLAYPSYQVRLGGGRNDLYWVTKGVPLFVSMSLSGRGTSVWRATQSNRTHKVVLKSAWRDEKSRAESDIYTLAGKHPGVASFVDGGDVFYPGSGGAVPMSFKNLESRGERTLDFGNPTLHRVSIQPVGKPLWEFETAKEFLEGFTAAIRGHQFLTEKGILHRDINPGNVFLWNQDENDMTMQDGQQGFIADLELAFLPQGASKLREGIAPEAHISPMGHVVHKIAFNEDHYEMSGPGPTMTGTAHFIATEVLKAGLEGYTVPRKIHHDLESFIWVALYSIYKHALQKEGVPKALNKEFKTFFGCSTLEKITSIRDGAMMARREILMKYIPIPLVIILHDFSGRLIQQAPSFGSSFVQGRPDLARRMAVQAKEPVPITYEQIFKSLEEALKGLEE